MPTVTTRLSDAVIPEVYLSYKTDESPEKSTFMESGVVVTSAELTASAATANVIDHTPFWKDLDADVEPNYSTDDPDVKSSPGKVSSGQFATRTSYLNKSYSTMDLVAILAGSDPMQRIRNRFGAYWTRQWQRRLIAQSVGVMASNVANNSGDMVLNLAIETGNSATSANLFSRAAFTSACFTMGDRGEEIMAIAVHSVVYKRMIDNDDIDFIPDSKGNMSIPTYLGRRVIVDDMMPVVAGTTNGFKYTSVLFGGAAFGFGEATPAVPVEVWRDPAAGNGGGMDVIFERKTQIIHPFGFNWTETTVTGQSPTLANLRAAANYTRVTARKNVPLAFLVTNG